MDPINTTAPINATDKRKVLVIHGFTQTSAVIHKKLINFLPKKGIDFCAPDAPIILDDEGRRAWVLLKPADLSDDTVFISQADLELLYTAAEAFAGAYDTIIGYSQGCLVVQLLIEKGLIRGNKLILINPIPAPKNNPDILSGVQSTIKTRLYLGDDDEWVPAKHTSFIDYQTRIHSDDPSKLEIIHHPKGHKIPVTKVYRDQYKSFLFE
jgi:pimeloyl-ACP methyl ester carboxylesterase